MEKLRLLRDASPLRCHFLVAVFEMNCRLETERPQHRTRSGYGSRGGIFDTSVSSVGGDGSEGAEGACCLSTPAVSESRNHPERRGSKLITVPEASQLFWPRRGRHGVSG